MMSDAAQQIEIFRDFAKNHLKIHSSQLNAPYQNQEPAFLKLGHEAYRERQQIFEKELTEKIDQIITDENQFLRPALEELKNRFMEKLRPGVNY
jgi:hypothetical protein